MASGCRMRNRSEFARNRPSAIERSQSKLQIDISFAKLIYEVEIGFEVAERSAANVWTIPEDTQSKYVSNNSTQRRNRRDTYSLHYAYSIRLLCFIHVLIHLFTITFDEAIQLFARSSSTTYELTIDFDWNPKNRNAKWPTRRLFSAYRYCRSIFIELSMILCCFTFLSTTWFDCCNECGTAIDSQINRIARGKWMEIE